MTDEQQKIFDGFWNGKARSYSYDNSDPYLDEVNSENLFELGIKTGEAKLQAENIRLESEITIVKAEYDATVILLHEAQTAIMEQRKQLISARKRINELEKQLKQAESSYDIQCNSLEAIANKSLSIASEKERYMKAFAESNEHNDRLQAKIFRMEELSEDIIKLFDEKILIRNTDADDNYSQFLKDGLRIQFVVQRLNEFANQESQ